MNLKTGRLLDRFDVARRTRALRSSSSVVRIDGVPHEWFCDLRDATASARIAKQKNPKSVVVVADVRTSRLVFEVKAWTEAQIAAALMLLGAGAEAVAALIPS